MNQKNHRYETQAQREARLSKDHDYDDCVLAARGLCWICLERGRERAEDLLEIEAKDGRVT